MLAASCATKPPVPEEKPIEKPPPPICAVESPDLCLQDGIDLWVGNGREVDRDAALKKFELACAGGLAQGCTYVAIALRGTDDIVNQARAFDLLDQSCQVDEPMACTQLGTEYLSRAWMKQEQTGQPQTAGFVAANEALRRACQTTISDEDLLATWGFAVRGYACGNLASSYEHGHGVPKDLVRARELNEFSCELGWMRSCAQVAFFYDKGLGVEIDAERARKMYEEACNQDDAMACHNLAMLLRVEDPERAKALLQKSCDQRFPGSCKALEEAPPGVPDE